jgi:small subunit ribosomal protein S17
MADEDKTTEEVIPAIAEETEVAEVEAAAEAAVEAEADADVEADVAADADAAVADEPAERIPSITTASTPKQRKEAREAARLAEAGSRPTRTPEERQAERDTERKAKAAARRLRRGQERETYKASEHERVPTPAREHVVGLQKTRQGIVTSDKASKTITVRIDVARPHRKYKKIVRTSMTLHAHDESNNAHIGDTVVVTESRPLSATKRWRLVEVIERAK